MRAMVTSFTRSFLKKRQFHRIHAVYPNSLMWTHIARWLPEAGHLALEKIIIAVLSHQRKSCSHFIDIGRENIIPVTSGCEE